MDDIFLRTGLLIGPEAINKLKSSRVAVFGVGGVGSFVTEALARASVGKIDIFDGDVVDVTNINRQLIALHSTIGMSKVEVMKKRLLDINPEIVVNAHHVVFNASNASEFSFEDYDYIVDAIDMVSSKLLIISKARKISSLKVVYSKEMPLYKPENKVNSSISFVPSVGGLMIASEIVRDLIKDYLKN